MDPILLHQIVENSGITWKDAQQQFKGFRCNPPFEEINSKLVSMKQDYLKKYLKMLDDATKAK